MFGKNNSAKVSAEYKKHEQKMMDDAKIRAEKKKEEDFLNETITVSRKDLMEFLDKLTHDNATKLEEFSTKGEKEIFTFLSLDSIFVCS